MKKVQTYWKPLIITMVLIFGASSISGFAGPIADPQNDEYITTLDFNDIELSFGELILDNQEFATIELDDQGFTTTIGQAKLPMIRATVEIPQGSDPEITILSQNWEFTSLLTLDLPEQIIPVQSSIQKDMKIASPSEFSMDTGFYTQDTFFPTEIASIADLGEIRGRKFALVELSPMLYNPSTGDLQILNSCSIEIRIKTCDYEQTYHNMQRYYNPEHEDFFKELFVNYGELENDIAYLEKDPQGYLFIVYDDFYDEIQPLVSQKENKGFDVTVTTTSEIPGGPTVANIESYINDAYTNWPTPPAYILLVGDTGQVPTKTTGLEYGVSCSDLYYVTINTGDFLPDIYIGRFPASTGNEVTTMVAKTVYYIEGDFPSNEWIKKAAFIASSDYGQLAEETHNFVIDTFLTPHEYICDKIYEASGGTGQDISNALNDGRSLCVYSGHGYSGGWGCVPFDQSDVNNLQNADMYPFVCSHACSTNPFDNSECFGETWLRAENKGGIAFWGASASTYWDEDDILERGMFQGWWANGLTTIGGMTDMGLYRVYENYSGGGMSQYYFEAYNVLGDPSIVVVGSEGSGSNTAPNTPETPEGPNEGETGISYNFTTSTTDPDDDDVYYMWHWGNEVSEWFGPYNSGEIVQIPHKWNAAGEFEIKVMAKDSEGHQSSWSDSITIEIIAIPLIEVGEITGGFGVSAVIKNVGAIEATDVQWTITCDGLVFLGNEKTGTFDKIMPGFGPTATTGFIFGVGPVDITVTADDAEKTVKAFLLGPFVLNIE